MTNKIIPSLFLTLSLTLFIQPPTIWADDPLFVPSKRPGEEDTLYCSLARFFPFTHTRFLKDDAFSKVGWDYMAASHLAMQHFNDRDPVVVPELADLGNCSLKIPIETSKVFDSAFSRSASLRDLFSIMQPTPSVLTENATEVEEYYPPCGVLGPFDGEATERLEAVTSAFNLLHLFYSAEIESYSNGADVIMSTVIRPRFRAQLYRELLMAERHEGSLLDDQVMPLKDPRPYVAVIHYGRDMSADLGVEMQDLSEGVYPQFFVRTFKLQGRSHEVRLKLANDIKRTGITTIIINLDHALVLNNLSKALDEAGMLTDEYMYFLSPMNTMTDHRLGLIQNGKQVPGSSLDKLLSGALVLDQLDGYMKPEAMDPTNVFENFDPFLRVWRRQDARLVSVINDHFPLKPDHKSYWQAPPDYFEQGSRPSNLASFVYDAVITLGIGGCRALQDNNASEVFQEEAVDAMMANDFTGASGRIRFARNRHYRMPEDLTMGLYNIRGESVPYNATHSFQNYSAILTHTWTGKKGWSTVLGTEIKLRNGATTFPPPMLNVEENYLPYKIRIFGLTLFGVCTFIVLVCTISVFLMRKNPVIRKTQPIFVLLLCTGSFITNLAIFTLSWDEGAGASQDQLDIACMATPWFFFIGLIFTFMAMATKLWRLSQLMHAWRRKVVLVHHVLGPLIVLMIAALVFLVVWTIRDPFHWERETISEELPPETYGQCRSDNLWIYAGPLVGIMFVAEFAAGFFALKSYNLPEDLSDGRSVMLALFAQVQGWLVGLPILGVLENSSATATYLGRIFILAVFSTSAVLILVVPKIFQAKVGTRGEEDDDARFHVSGVLFDSNSKPNSSKFSKLSNSERVTPDPSSLGHTADPTTN